MTESRKNTVRRIYSVCLAVWTAVVGVAFIVQIYSIYFSADKYTVQNISAHFQEIAVLFWLWIAGGIGGGILGWTFPQNKEKPKAYIETQAVLEKLKRRLPANGDDLSFVKKEKNIRLTLRIASAAACLIALVVSLTILLDKSYAPRFGSAFFTSHYGAADRLLRVFPWVLGAMLACIGTGIVSKYSYIRETDGVKKAIAENAKAGIKTESGEKRLTLSEKLAAKCAFMQTKGWKIGVRAALGVLGVVLVIVGISNGGMRDVLMKAINICTQCIGLG
ncbi:MAG: hypothetical protein IJX91_05830 [Clostridia bacterium]|nr:hypothetical protein [Clostridia bacterium]